MANLRAAVIGYGAMGKNHARILKSLNDVDLIAILDQLQLSPMKR